MPHITFIQNIANNKAIKRKIDQELTDEIAKELALPRRNAKGNNELSMRQRVCPLSKLKLMLRSALKSQGGVFDLGNMGL
ncbi:hypothetical protein MMC28_007639 [Mycoblastus sanguinarius]|nr:hypothetical protein [Mycoblastus sanguinarius]